MITEKKREELIQFVHSREQLEGGYSFSQTTPATLEDTYFALRILEELKELSISKQTISYITRLNPNEFNQPKHLHQLAVIYRFTNQKHSEKNLFNKIKNKKGIMVNTLSDLYYMTLIKELFKITSSYLTEKEQDILTSVQMKTTKSMEEYKQLISIMKKFHIKFSFQEYTSIIQKSQNYDGGFGVVPHSTSYIEPTYHALHSLKELNAKPININQCESFIDSCITNIGGFGRQTVTVPTLEYSYYALMSLKIIEEMKK